jgi:hypothetical protein
MHVFYTEITRNSDDVVVSLEPVTRRTRKTLVVTDRSGSPEGALL